MPVDGYVVN